MYKSAISAVLAVACIACLLLVTVQAVSQGPSNNVTFTGTVSCSKCQGIQPLHKGYTRWTWALHSVNEGDDIVLVVGDDVYKLQGDKNKILQFMERKATVTGTLDGQRMAVQTIVRPEKNK
jgi:type 1 fimbria pilin